MPRPVSWLPRLYEINKTVTNSVRSHYDRRDIETLFELQPRAAQEMLKLLPSVQVGTSKLIDREVLLKFLQRVREAENVSGLLEEIRHEPALPLRRRIRSLVRRDLEPVSSSSLPDSIHLSRGHLEVNFGTVEQLAEAMLILARILQSEGDVFAQSYEPRTPPPETQEASAVRSMFAELRSMEAAQQPPGDVPVRQR